MGSSINYALDLETQINFLLANRFLNKEEFLVSGTFNVPANVTNVLVVGCGGGASGSKDGVGLVGTNEGGGGAPLGIQSVDVTPSSAISVVIGGGGAAAGIGVNGAPGNNGNTSLFGTLQFKGGVWAGGTSGGKRPRVNASLGGSPSALTFSNEGQDTANHNGGAGDANTGGGGAGPFGDGTDGVTGGGTQPGAANTGAGSGSSSGGALGDGTGEGGSGRIIVLY